MRRHPPGGPQGQGRRGEAGSDRRRPGSPQHEPRQAGPPTVPHARQGRILLYGLHAVEAALRNPKRRLHRLWLAPNAAERLAEVVAVRKLTPEALSPRDIDRMLEPDAVHQGAALEAEPLAEPSLEALAAPGSEGQPALLVVLDQVTDPHNVGAILRSSAAFGVRGLVMTERHSPPLAGALAKAASGALEHVGVHLAINLSRALAELADHGVERIGLDGEATEAIERVASRGATALVLGAEGRGLRRLTREHCDRLCRISTRGGLASLNVSNAAAIALHTLAMNGGAITPSSPTAAMDKAPGAAL
jgi:23S rRNA (guanosine2251-2'-O)-methyltransferase